VTIAYEAFSYGVDDFAPFLANLLDDLRRVKADFFQALDERGRSVATPVVLEQCGETHNKVKWAARLGDTTFNFYIPKWRVPEPWPDCIAVTISISDDEDSTRHGGRSMRAKDRSLPISSVTDRVSDHSRTALGFSLG
jgi:hypothetical protein